LIKAQASTQESSNMANRTSTSAARKKIRPSSTSSTEAMAHLADLADRMHQLLAQRADDLMGCVKGSAEDKELAAITDALEAYEQRRWPGVPSLKG